MISASLVWHTGRGVLVTFDGTDLLAYDADTAAPRWRTGLAHAIAGIALADSSSILAVDADGRLHTVDAAAGTVRETLDPLGPPEALAVSREGAIALALRESVHVVRKNGGRLEIATRARALAFSTDGAVLAIGTVRGAVELRDASTGELATAAIPLKEPPSVLAQHPSGAWVAALSRGVVCIDGPGEWRLLRGIPSARRLAFDAGGRRLAVQTTERHVVVLAWPSLEEEARVELDERPVGDVAFGPEDALGIALDHGDASTVDLMTKTVRCTRAHPGRMDAAWSLQLVAPEDDVLLSHAHAPRAGFRRRRVAIPAVLMFGLLVLRLAARTSSPRSFTPPDPAPPLASAAPAAAPAIAPRKIPHPQLVHLAGPNAPPTVEAIPELRPEEGEIPTSVWAAPDGTAFVAAHLPRSASYVIHRRSAAGLWQIVQRHSEPSEHTMRLFGRSSSDLYATVRHGVLHFDGTRWSELATPGDAPLASAALAGGELFVATEDGVRLRLFRRRGDGWAAVSMGGLELVELAGGGSGLWAIAASNDRDVVAQRAADGRWSVRYTRNPETGALPIVPWVSPSGDPFVGTDVSILRGVGQGARWIDDHHGVDGVVLSFWGRSNDDVYAACSSHLLHFDGKSWRETSYVGPIEAISGTAKELLVVRADE